MDFGDKLKQLRIKMNLTQEELASRCDLTKGFISQIERNNASPSIATLMDILETLGTDLKHFFSDSDSEEKIIFGEEDIFTQENNDLGFDILWLIPNAQKNIMEPILINIKPGGKSETYSPYKGEVFGYVMKGPVNLNIGKSSYKLNGQESFYFKLNQPFYVENTEKSEASVILVSTPPVF